MTGVMTQSLEVTSLTPGTAGDWVWLLRSRPDQVAKPTCGEARHLVLYPDAC